MRAKTRVMSKDLMGEFIKFFNVLSNSIGLVDAKELAI
jgi:hypothetical protein